MAAADRHEATLLIARDGIPAAVRDKRLPHEKQRAVNFILLSTCFERIAFYAFVNTLFSTQVKEPFYWSESHSKTAAYIFSGISYTSTLLFAVFSDWRLGRPTTIIIGFVLYLVGLMIVTITASGNNFLCQYNQTEHHNQTSIFREKCAPTILGTLIFTALGVGAIKSNLVTLGAEQNQDQESRQTSRYFEFYGVAVNVGSMIAIGLFPYLQHILPPHLYYILYVVAMAMLLFATIFFFIGWKYYLHIPTGETVIFRCFPVIISACRSWYRFKRKREPKSRRKTNEINREETVMGRLDRPTRVVESEDAEEIRDNLPSLLDFARVPYGGTHLDRHVDEVKALRSALLVFAMLVPFWLVYDQIGTTFQSQGMNMRGSKLSYVVTWISLGDPVIVIVGIAVLNLLVYKHLDTRHGPFWIARKLVLGMAFAALSMCAAGIVEIFRQKECIGTSGSGLSIFAQLPQSFLIGFSQLFGMVGGYEYAYFAAPRSSQSLFMSLYFCSIGVSFVLGTIYFNVFPSPNVYVDFQCGIREEWYWSYYTYFFIIAAVQLLAIVVFIIGYRLFGLVHLNRQQLDESQTRRRPSTGFSS